MKEENIVATFSIPRYLYICLLSVLLDTGLLIQASIEFCVEVRFYHRIGLLDMGPVGSSVKNFVNGLCDPIIELIFGVLVPKVVMA